MAFPRRYIVVLMNLLLFIISIGFRTTYSMVMTHAIQVNGSRVGENIFPNCTTIGTNRDFQAPWTGEQVSLTHTVYFLGTFISNIPAGALAIWLSPRRVVTISLFLTSVLYLIMSVAIRNSYGFVMFIRFVQGLLEGGIVPGAMGVLSSWSSEGERSRFMSVSGCGAYFSPVIAMVVTGAMACYVQWDAGLYLYSGVGIVLAIVYRCLLYDRPQDDPHITQDELKLFNDDDANTKVKPKLMSVPWKQLLTSMPIYAIMVGAFLRNYVFALMVTEQPAYFKDAFGMNIATIGLLSAVPQLAMGTVACLSGFIIDLIKNKKWLSNTNSRKLAQTIGASADAVCFLGLYFVESHQWKVALTLMCVGVGLSGFVISEKVLFMMAFPRRYIVVLMNFWLLVISIGFKTTYSMVMTHVIQVNGSIPGENIFRNCSTIGTDRDFQLPWTGQQMSLTHTIYFLGMFISSIPAGALSIWISPRRVVTTSIFITSVFYLILTVAIQNSYGLVMFIRFVQGLLEGGVIPGVVGLLASWSPEGERSRMMSVSGCGAYFSPVIAMVVTGVMACYVQWDSGLYLYGGVGIVSSTAYGCLLYDRPQDDPYITPDELELFNKDTSRLNFKPKLMSIPWKRLLTSMPIYCTVVGAFLRNYVFALMQTQEPVYFKDAFGMNIATIGLLFAVPQLSMGVVSCVSGFIIDFIRNKKWLSKTNSRKLAQTIGSSADAVCFIGLYFVGSHQWKVALTLLCIGIGLSGFIISGFYANILELAPPYASLISAFSRLGIIGAVISTAVVGAVAGNSHDIKDWQTVFLITGILNIVGVVFYNVFASGETLSWVTEEDTVLIEDSKQQSNGAPKGEYNSLLQLQSQPINPFARLRTIFNGNTNSEVELK